MSRKFLDDGVEVRLVLNGGVGFDHLPVINNQYYEPGHMCLDPISGKRFVNEGSPDRPGSLFVNDQYNALILHEKLEILPSTAGTGNTALDIVGTSAANGTVAFATTGGVTLTTPAVANNQEITEPNTNSVWGTVSLIADSGLVFETQIVTGANITAAIIWAGLKLTNTSTTATDDDQVFFRYQDTVNGGRFQVIDSNTGVDNANDSGVTVAVSTSYLLQIRIDNSRVPHYLINGELVYKGNALKVTTALKPFVGVQTTTTAAKAITIRHERIVLPRAPIA